MSHVTDCCTGYSVAACLSARPDDSEVSQTEAMAAKLDVSGPGLMLVFSQITRPDLVSEGLFAEWYEEEHIPEATATSGMPAGFRYYCLDPPRGRPWLALYPCPDLEFVNSEEYKSIRVTSNMLPTETSFDVADFDVRYYERWQISERPGTEPGKAFISCFLSPQDNQDLHAH